MSLATTWPPKRNGGSATQQMGLKNGEGTGCKCQSRLRYPAAESKQSLRSCWAPPGASQSPE
eukprot:1281432-Alexandrium_andersonii.AAC.1